jgi:hypothetical protein
MDLINLDTPKKLVRELAPSTSTLPSRQKAGAVVTMTSIASRNTVDPAAVREEVVGATTSTRLREKKSSQWISRTLVLGKTRQTELCLSPKAIRIATTLATKLVRVSHSLPSSIMDSAGAVTTKPRQSNMALEIVARLEERGAKTSGREFHKNQNLTRLLAHTETQEIEP